jgi:hypothetical protein
MDSIDYAIDNWNGENFSAFVETFKEDELEEMRSFLEDHFDRWFYSEGDNEHVVRDYITYELTYRITEGMSSGIDQRLKAWYGVLKFEESEMKKRVSRSRN